MSNEQSNHCGVVITPLRDSDDICWRCEQTE